MPRAGATVTVLTFPSEPAGKIVTFHRPTDFIEKHKNSTPVPPNQPPTAGFTMTSIPFQPVPHGQTLNLTVAPGGSAGVIFDGSSRSTDPDGSVTGWQWAVNGVAASTQSSFSRSFAVGTYSVGLVVTDNSGTPSVIATGTVIVASSSSSNASFLYYQNKSSLSIQLQENAAEDSGHSIDETTPLIGTFQTSADSIQVTSRAVAQITYSRQQLLCFHGSPDLSINILISKDRITRAPVVTFSSFDAIANGDVLQASSRVVNPPSYIFEPNTTYYIYGYSGCAGDRLRFRSSESGFTGYIYLPKEAAQRWTRVYPTLEPPGLYGPAMAYDEARGQVILVGGCMNAGCVNGTWIWAGGNWRLYQQQDFDASPSRAGGHTMSYDAIHQKVVLFGGFPGNETWLWNGTHWQVQSPAAVPHGRVGQSMAYDWSKGNTVIYGGGADPSTGVTLWSDTWIWDGLTWSEKVPYTSNADKPAPTRASSAMSWDPVTRRVVLYGGHGISCGGGCYNPIIYDDTWLWKERHGINRIRFRRTVRCAVTVIKWPSTRLATESCSRADRFYWSQYWQDLSKIQTTHGSGLGARGC